MTNYTVPHSLPVIEPAIDPIRSATGDNLWKQINALAASTNNAISTEGARVEATAAGLINAVKIAEDPEDPGFFQGPSMALRMPSVNEDYLFPVPLEDRLDKKHRAYTNSVTSGEIVSNLAFSLVQAPQPTPVTLSTVRGTPVYGLPAKYISAQSGGVTKASGVIPNVPVLTFDGWFMQPATPSGATVDIVWSIGGFMYVALEPSTGFLSYVQTGSKKRTAPVNVCDGVWHHVAVELTRSGTSTVTLSGFWLDGKPIAGAAVSSSSEPWSADLTLGGNPGSGFDLAGSLDSVRISDQAIFPRDAFTPPGWHNRPTYYATFIAHMDNAQATKYAFRYPPRPPTAPGGSVTYTGTTKPVDWITNDRWVKV